MNLPKKNVCFVIPSDVVAKNFILSGALKDLAERCNLFFFVSKSVTLKISGKNISIEPKLLRSAFFRRIDLFFWFHSLYLFMRKHNLKDEDSFKVSKLSWLARRAHQIFALPFLSFTLEKIDRFLFKKDVVVLNHLSRICPDLLIVPGVAIDNFSHIFLRTANYSSIPTLMVVTHWDYFTKKGLLRTVPNKLFVWGEDMKESVLRNEIIDPSDVQIVGVPHFEKYMRKLPAKKIARKNLGLDLRRRWFFFPGAGLPFDEIYVIERLVKFFEKENMEFFGLIYRPHPKAWSRLTKSSVEALTSSPNVFIDLSSDNSDQHFRNLLGASEAIISPFSTMILEGGITGLPSFCLGFSDEINSWDWSQVNDFEHLKPLNGREWIVVCKKSKDLEVMFSLFLKKIEKNVKLAVKKNVSKTVYFDEISYSKRFANAVESIFSPPL